MNEAAKLLQETVKAVIARVHFQPGYPSWKEINVDHLPAVPGASKTTTWCNEAANAVLVELGYDTRPILEPKGIGWTGATKLYENAASVSAVGGAGVFEVSARQAQAWADRGIPVLAAAKNPIPGKASHVGIVCPAPNAWDPTAGPWIGQAGAKNGFRNSYESFVRWGLTSPRFYLLPIKV